MSPSRRIFLFLFAACSLASCSATRKISQVGLREPASVQVSISVSELRSQIIESREFAKACPQEIRDNFAKLAAERIHFPGCPSGLNELVQTAIPYLKLEERSTMEEVINSQCRSLGNSEFGDALENLLANYDSSGPLGRRAKIVQTLLPLDGETRNLQNLQGAVQELVDYHLPLDRWVRRNGDHVLPDEELTHLNRLIFTDGCRMTDQEVDQGYRTIRGLEELAKILKDGPQRDRIQSFLLGVDKVISQKLKEFFYP